MPHHDGHPVFEAELKKWGSHSTGTVAYHGKVVQYGCPCCKNVMNRKKRIPRNKKYICVECKEPIVFLGEKII
jgi:predicted SprT family Zn-dependent metalloprotease